MQITDEDFTVMESDEEDFYAVRIDKGMYSGVIFKFGKIDIKENDDGKGAACSFEYNAVYSPENFTLEELDKDTEFGELAGEVLNFLLVSSINSVMGNEA